MRPWVRLWTEGCVPTSWPFPSSLIPGCSLSVIRDPPIVWSLSFPWDEHHLPPGGGPWDWFSGEPTHCYCNPPQARWEGDIGDSIAHTVAPPWKCHARRCSDFGSIRYPPTLTGRGKFDPPPTVDGGRERGRKEKAVPRGDCIGTTMWMGAGSTFVKPTSIESSRAIARGSTRSCMCNSFNSFELFSSCKFERVNFKWAEFELLGLLCSPTCMSRPQPDGDLFTVKILSFSLFN